MPQELSLATGLTSKSTGEDTAVVICNGPSLASVPNEWLDKYPTFGANRVWLKYSPDVLLTLDLKMVHNKILQDEMVEGFKGSPEVFISPIVEEKITPARVADNVTVVKRWQNIVDEEGNLQPSFSQQPDDLLVSGGSVTYGLLQFAYWKGFRKVLMVGCNHAWRDPRGYHFDSRYNEEVKIPYERENVDPERVASGPGTWFWSEEIFVMKVNMFYDVARQIYEQDGREIINCTPDTKVPAEIFKIDDWRNY